LWSSPRRRTTEKRNKNPTRGKGIGGKKKKKKKKKKEMSSSQKEKNLWDEAPPSLKTDWGCPAPEWPAGLLGAR